MRARWLWVLALQLLCSCSAVFTTEPIGKEPAGLQAQRSEWEGVWSHVDGAAVVQIAKEGDQARVYWLRQEGRKVLYDEVDVTLRRYGHLYIANARDLDHPGRFVWGVIEKESGTLKIWVPDAARFEERIKQKRLNGSIDWEGDVILDGLNDKEIKEVLAEFARGASDGQMFYHTPIVVIRSPTSSEDD
jgi:hypothetical protein